MNYAIILASGTGSRVGGNVPKLFVRVGNMTILEHTISVFEKNKNTNRIILVANRDYLDFCRQFKFKKLYAVVEGGQRRQDSSRIGVNLVEENNAKVLIHDGARPFVNDEIIDRCYGALDTYNAVNTGVETSDTIIQIDNDGMITKTLDRKTLQRCQTPQGFRACLIKKAHAIALEKNIQLTDDAGLIVKLGIDKVFVVKGDVNNVKITYPADIDLAIKRLG